MGVIIPAFPVQNFAPIPYVGTFTGNPVWLLTQPPQITNQNQVVNSGNQSFSVQTIFHWDTDYLQSQASTVIIQGTGGAATPINKILMVYVNNALNNTDVTVYFPDTGMFITCPAGSAGYYPVFTFGLVANVYNGYTGEKGLANTGFSTQILFCNFAVPGFLAQTENKTQNVISTTFSFSNSFVNPILTPGRYEIISIEAYVWLINNVAAAGYVLAAFNIGEPTFTDAPIGFAQGSLVATAAIPATPPVFAPVTRLFWPNQPYLYPYSTGLSVKGTLSNCSEGTGVINIAYNELSS